MENSNIQSEAICTAVVEVIGEQAKRWCAAVWSTSPGEQQLVGEIQRLVDSTTLAHWMRPPAQYERSGEVVNSFDLIFYETVQKPLRDVLKENGFYSVRQPLLRLDEYEQFEAFNEKARKGGRQVGSPKAVWRLPFHGVEQTAPGELGERVARRMGDEVWGQAPGRFSHVFCDELSAVTGVDVEPSREGMNRLETAIAAHSGEGLRWLEPMAYQAICDFVGVVLQANWPVQVQWGSCPVDEASGLAPLPVLRVRRPGGMWTAAPVGRDVFHRLCVPWGERRPKGLWSITERYAGDSEN